MNENYKNIFQWDLLPPKPKPGGKSVSKPKSHWEFLSFFLFIEIISKSNIFCPFDSILSTGLSINPKEKQRVNEGAYKALQSRTALHSNECSKLPDKQASLLPSREDPFPLSAISSRRRRNFFEEWRFRIESFYRKNQKRRSDYSVFKSILTRNESIDRWKRVWISALFEAFVDIKVEKDVSNWNIDVTSGWHHWNNLSYQ